MTGDLVAQEIRIRLFLGGLLLVPDDDFHGLGTARPDRFACAHRAVPSPRSGSCRPRSATAVAARISRRVVGRFMSRFMGESLQTPQRAVGSS